eukprot:TRINITY_DN39790_c0_g1_i1.p1 TRINITY_DN39790_c0_g1~~TRINITY_DN39790_c0_g1_i1.p1  ORF type:complete len:538 (+),score=127.92 TRINITY_DN39790_c0_g1_i1:120-1733(+)
MQSKMEKDDMKAMMKEMSSVMGMMGMQGPWEKSFKATPKPNSALAPGRLTTAKQEPSAPVLAGSASKAKGGPPPLIPPKAAVEQPPKAVVDQPPKAAVEKGPEQEKSSVSQKPKKQKSSRIVTAFALSLDDKWQVHVASDESVQERLDDDWSWFLQLAGKDPTWASTTSREFIFATTLEAIYAKMRERGGIKVLFVPSAAGPQGETAARDIAQKGGRSYLVGKANPRFHDVSEWGIAAVLQAARPYVPKPPEPPEPPEPPANPVVPEPAAPPRAKRARLESTATVHTSSSASAKAVTPAAAQQPPPAATQAPPAAFQAPPAAFQAFPASAKALPAAAFQTLPAAAFQALPAAAMQVFPAALQALPAAVQAPLTAPQAPPAAPEAPPAARQTSAAASSPQKELRRAVKHLGTREGLQDKESIPTLATEIENRWLAELGGQEVFDALAHVFRNVKGEGHRKAIVYVAHELLCKRKGRSLEAEGRRAACFEAFLLPIGNEISTFRATEREAYNKLVAHWSKKVVLTGEELAKLMHAWATD